MRVVITAATKGEWMPAYRVLETSGKELGIHVRMYSEASGVQIDKPVEPSGSFLHNDIEVIFHESGVGMLATTFSLTRLVLEEKPDMIIQVGIAGSFTQRPLSEVFVINKEYIGDTGVLEQNNWLDLFDLQLTGPDHTPFEDKALPNQGLLKYNVLQLPIANAITVNTISTDKEHILRLKEKYKPDLESMEGAVLHFVCRKTDTPFLQFRAVSNYVGIRDKKQWSIGAAISALNETLLKYMEKMAEGSYMSS